MSPSDAVEKYGKLIYYTLSKRGITWTCDYYEDLVQDGYVCLMDCLSNYKDSLGIKFSTYFSTSWYYKSMERQSFYLARGLTGGVKRALAEGNKAKIKNVLEMVNFDGTFQNDKQDGEIEYSQLIGKDDEGYEYIEFCEVLDGLERTYTKSIDKKVSSKYFEYIKKRLHTSSEGFSSNIRSITKLRK